MQELLLKCSKITKTLLTNKNNIMEKVINLDKLKESLETSISQVSQSLTKREADKLNKVIEEKNFYYEVVKNCADIIIELYQQAEETMGEVEQEYSIEKDLKQYYDNIAILGQLYDSVKDDIFATDLKDRLRNCMDVELNKMYNS